MNGGALARENHRGDPWWRPADEGLPLLCGHVHEKWQERERQFNVGVDVRGFAPVAETTIAEWLVATSGENT